MQHIISSCLSTREGLFGALLLGKLDGQGGPRYCGSVGSGFTVAGLAEVLDFFNTYRAWVRAKVIARRLEQPTLSGDKRRSAVGAPGDHRQTTS